MIINTLLALVITALILWGVIWFVGRERKEKIRGSLGMQLLSVRLSKKKKKDNAVGQGTSVENWKDELNLSAQLFGILGGLKSPFALEAAVHHVGEQIHFYLAVQRNSVPAISRQVEGLWKDAQVQPIDDYNVFNSGGASQGFYLQQKFSSALPIRTYVEASVDTFAPILSGLSSIKEIGEGAAIQIIGKPAPRDAKKNSSQMIARLRKGEKAEDVLGGLKIELKDITSVVWGKSDAKKEDEKKVIVDEEAVKALESKIAKSLLSVNVRVVASAGVQFETESILEGLSRGFEQFSAPLRQEFKIVKP